MKTGLFYTVIFLFLSGVSFAEDLGSCSKEPDGSAVSSKVDNLVNDLCSIDEKSTGPSDDKLEDRSCSRKPQKPAPTPANFSALVNDAFKNEPYYKPNPEQQLELQKRLETYSQERCFGGEVKLNVDTKMNGGKGYASSYMTGDNDPNAPSNPTNRKPFAPDAQYQDPKQKNTYYTYTPDEVKKLLAPQLDEQIAYIDKKRKDPANKAGNTFQFCPNPSERKFMPQASFKPVAWTCSVTYSMNFKDNVSDTAVVPTVDNTPENAACEKLVKERGGTPSGGLIKSSSSSLNNTKPPFCGKKFKELSADRADKTAVAIRGAIPGLPQFDRPSGTNTTPQFSIDDKGFNGDGTSGKCAYKWDPVNKREVQLSEAEYPKSEREKSQYSKAIVTYSIPPDRNATTVNSQVYVTACPLITIACKLGR